MICAVGAGVHIAVGQAKQADKMEYWQPRPSQSAIAPSPVPVAFVQQRCSLGIRCVGPPPVAAVVLRFCGDRNGDPRSLSVTVNDVMAVLRPPLSGCTRRPLLAMKRGPPFALAPTNCSGPPAAAVFALLKPPVG